MTVRSYAILVGPTEKRADINLLIAMIQHENLRLSESLIRPANADGSSESVEFPELSATHWFAGRFVDADWLNTYQNLGTSLPAPDGGWPLLYPDDETEALTEADAIAAAAAVVIQVTTGEDTGMLPETTLSAACNALGIVPIT